MLHFLSMRSIDNDEPETAKSKVSIELEMKLFRIWGISFSSFVQCKLLYLFSSEINGAINYLMAFGVTNYLMVVRMGDDFMFCAHGLSFLSLFFLLCIVWWASLFLLYELVFFLLIVRDHRLNEINWSPTFFLSMSIQPYRNSISSQLDDGWLSSRKCF